ncbi:hypothetical protein IFM89_025684 [Coptis chinensis]|uniref:Uncharacterized protein n=1 Tax=Coptis chinensis TaxID=261450 RepID=A0A835H2K4_9MAGN|nr:hypothetical protein IFM89_025684 [Coptis chinensis]
MVSGQPQPSASQPSGSASHASQPSISVSHASQPSGDTQESENVRKLPVLINIDGVVVGDNASRWNTRAGSLIRARILVSYTDWRLVHPDFKDKVWNALMNQQNPDKIHGRVDGWKAGHERHNGTVLESARARYELVEVAQKKRKNATSSGEGSATYLDFDNDKLTEVLGANKRNRTHGISSNLSKKQLKRTSIAKVMLAQARSSSNSEFKGEMSKMKFSIARVEGVLMDMLKLVTNNGMSNSQPPCGDTTPGTDPTFARDGGPVMQHASAATGSSSTPQIVQSISLPWLQPLPPPLETTPPVETDQTTRP